MRKLFLTALLGVCFAFPGLAKATIVNDSFSFELNESQDAPDQELVERILRHIQQEFGGDIECLCEQYANGEITIEKDGDRYLVKAGGGLIWSIEDSF